jgi:AmmeMemoRadiSam system protein A
LKAQVLNYANSGDVTGDKSRVVGYVSAVFVKGDEEMFSKAQKKRLLEIARQSISDYVSSGKRTDFKESDPALNAKNGVFVTLHKDGDLRGCIGSFTASEPLYQLVAKMAIESATGDPRFMPVTKEELPDIKIEISVLTEPKLIDDWKKIRLGIDGVIVRRGFASGVFLPQVATETGWDLETFLKQLCWQKAGLPEDSYKDPKTQLYTYQAYVFSEEE